MYTDSDGYLPEWLNDVGRFLAGVAISVVAATIALISAPLLIIPGFSTVPLTYFNLMFYGAMLVASPFSSSIKSDMVRIGWDFGNSNEKATAKSSKISFYKGVFVFRYGNSGGGGFSFGFIGLGRGASEKTVKHEYGHHKQQRLLGLSLYTPIVAIPSLLDAAFPSPTISHQNQWYERWATDWGNRGWLWW